MHIRARDDSEMFYKHLKKKFKQIRSVVLPESCRQVEKIVFEIRFFFFHFYLGIGIHVEKKAL